MTLPNAREDLMGLLRAEVKPRMDDQFVLTLAEVARSSAAVPIRARVPWGAKVGAIAASVAITMFGVAYASDLLAPAPPTNLNPTAPGTDEPSNRERETRGPRKPEEPDNAGDPDRSAATKSSDPGGAPTDGDDEHAPSVGTIDATAPAGPVVEHSPGGPTTEQPPPASDTEPGDDSDNADNADSDEPDSGETDGDGSGHDDGEPSEPDQEAPETNDSADVD